jgi:hypothetical protein
MDGGRSDLAFSIRPVIASQWVRSEVAAPMTGSAKRSSG